jgi:hypothetical protein
MYPISPVTSLKHVGQTAYMIENRSKKAVVVKLVTPFTFGTGSGNVLVCLTNEKWNQVSTGDVHVSNICLSGFLGIVYAEMENSGLSARIASPPLDAVPVLVKFIECPLPASTTALYKMKPDNFRSDVVYVESGLEDKVQTTSVQRAVTVGARFSNKDKKHGTIISAYKDGFAAIYDNTTGAVEVKLDQFFSGEIQVLQIIVYKIKK